MAQTVLITLTAAGSDTGPFDLYSDADGYVTPFENNIAKAILEAGYTSIVVPDGATIIRVQSDNSICENFTDLSIVTTTTTTTSSTSTTSTTTSTTSSTTSTTTTAAPIVLINILSNTSTDTCLANGGDIVVNSITASFVSGTVPTCIGDSSVFSTDQIGTFTVGIRTDSFIGGATVVLTDSALAVHCENVTAIIGGAVIFGGVTINTSNPINITVQDGVC